MKIVIGLGNPGEKYSATRHNVGFMVIDHLIKCWESSGLKKSFNGLIYDTFFSGEKVILAKPQTFMNRSGQCVAPLLGFYKLVPEELIVVHDDLDLQFGTIKIKKGGGNGGHNGLKSIDEKLGVNNKGYYRVRVGIGRPENNRILAADWVLQSFAKSEIAVLESLIESVVTSIELLIHDRAEEAMNRFNGKCHGEVSGK